MLCFLLMISGVALFIWSLFIENKFTQSWMAFVGGIVVVLSVLSTQPTASDVYKGKTTLRITYENNVPKDTTVIWKESKFWN